MTAPTAASGGSSMPWKWRLFLGGLVILAISVAPGPTGDFASAFLHGLGMVGCKISHTTCFSTENPAAQLNPMTQIQARVDDYGPDSTVLRRP